MRGDKSILPNPHVIAGSPGEQNARHTKNKDQKIQGCSGMQRILLTGIFGGEVDDVGARVSRLCCHSDGANRNSGLCGHASSE